MLLVGCRILRAAKNGVPLGIIADVEPLLATSPPPASLLPSSESKGMAVAKPTDVCYYCKGSGHWKQDCPLMKQHQKEKRDAEDGMAPA